MLLNPVLFQFIHGLMLLLEHLLLAHELGEVLIGLEQLGVVLEQESIRIISWPLFLLSRCEAGTACKAFLAIVLLDCSQVG